MTIQQLLDAAYRVGPKPKYQVQDSFTYGVGYTAPDRQTRLTVWGPGASAEDMFLDMDGDQVVAVHPGKTSLHWQVMPVLRAFHEWSVPA